MKGILAALLFGLIAANGCSRKRESVPLFSDKTPAQIRLRRDEILQRKISVNGRIDSPAKLAELCRQARIGCGFEIEATAWDRPDMINTPGTFGILDALRKFAGDEYRVELIDDEGDVNLLPARRASGLDESVTVAYSSSKIDGPAIVDSISQQLNFKAAPGPKAFHNVLISMPSFGTSSDKVELSGNAREIMNGFASPLGIGSGSWVVVHPTNGSRSALYWFTADQ